MIIFSLFVSLVGIYQLCALKSILLIFFMHYYSQVGKWDCKDRIRFLEEEYFFNCRCRGCSQMNISDLVINGYCCVNTSCTGVVLDSSVAACESEKLNHFLAAAKSLDHHCLVI